MESEVRNMGTIPIVSEDGDLKLGRDVVEKKIHERRARRRLSH